MGSQTLVTLDLWPVLALGQKQECVLNVHVFGKGLVFVSLCLDHVAVAKKMTYAPFCVGRRGLTRKSGQSPAAVCRKSGLKSLTQQRMIKANTPWRCSTAKRHTNGTLTCLDKVGGNNKIWFEGSKLQFQIKRFQSRCDKIFVSLDPDYYHYFRQPSLMPCWSTRGWSKCCPSCSRWCMACCDTNRKHWAARGNRLLAENYWLTASHLRLLLHRARPYWFDLLFSSLRQAAIAEKSESRVMCCFCPQQRLTDAAVNC